MNVLDRSRAKRKWIAKRVNWRVLNFAVYFEILMSYFLPFKVVDEFQYQVGFPCPFLTIYEKPIIHVNPYLSMGLNIVNLAADIVIIYFVMLLFLKL